MRLALRRRLVRAAGMLWGLLALSACTVPTRHEVLLFLFDGVPESPRQSVESLADVRPPEPETVSLALPPPLPFADGTASATLAAREPAARRRISDNSQGQHHFEMAQRQCLVCHDQNRGMEPVSRVERRFCDQCHQEQRLIDGWNHGPINLGQCLPCHVGGHEAPYPKLVTKPVAELCDHCHGEGGGKRMPFHKTDVLRVDIHDCTVCHDPHRVF